MDLEKNYRLLFILHKELLKTDKKKMHKNRRHKRRKKKTYKNSQAIHIKRFSHLLVVRKKKINITLVSDWQTFKRGDNCLSSADRNVNRYIFKKSNS